ncbi:hypothetical protein D9615_000926 [Tricholomella constricta]|uniref:PUM-HD domain-containing protein n=1 Tax=Tricholomella constricta TaxID=117010 RepID=A0A8H5HL45_9AGAR|nr:hypothetical protein D9615_000926 [Tricholomella constricta]
MNIPSDDSAHYVALYDPSPPRRQQATLAASIWAPQPQPSEATWPKTLDSFSRVAEQREFDMREPAIVRREDVFGPVPTQVSVKPKDIGAIGDGRKKNSPDFDDTHVEQLLRTLNLNSPAPTAKKPALSLNLNASPSSPDFSPASATSSLMTPTDLSPSTRSFDANAKLQQSPYELGPAAYNQQPSLLFEHPSPARGPYPHESYIAHGHGNVHTLTHSSSPLYRAPAYIPPNAPTFPFFEPFADTPASVYHSHGHTPAQTNSSGLANDINTNNTLSLPRTLYNHNASPASAPVSNRNRLPPMAMDWRLQPQPQGQSQLSGDWLLPKDGKFDYNSGAVGHLHDEPLGLRTSFVYQQQGQQGPGHSQMHQPVHHISYGGQNGGNSLPQTPAAHAHSHEPINFLSLLHPSSSPPYPVFVERIIKSSDQQASIFLQQKLKVADLEERAKIVDAICARGFEMMAHRFGNWAVQRCLEAASVPEERRKMVACMRGRVVELATNCYGCHVLQKALDCEEDIRLLIVSELLLGDPAQTLVNKHASHVWSKIMELSWTPPAPPIFAYVNKSLKGKWASLACHETGSLVVQHAFENLEAEAKDGIVDELINNGPAVFAEVAKNQWGSYCIQHILEHGSEAHRAQTLQHLLDGLLDFATSEQGAKSVVKALKEGGKATLDRIVERMCEAAKGSRRAMIVDLALSVTGSQLIASVLPTADKDQRALLYDCIRGHIVTLRGYG